MTQRVVTGASAVIFIVVVVMAHLMVGMHDRSSPVAMGSPPRVVLDFAKANVRDEAALAALRKVDQEAGLGLVKQGADLSGDLRGVVLLPVTDAPNVPAVVARYEDAPARVVGHEVWAHTAVSGTYYVTGGVENLAGATVELERMGIQVSRDDTTTRTGISAVVRIPGMLVTFVTGCVLLVTLVLFWLAVKAQRRALAVLAGAKVSRLQAHDLGQLMLLVVTAWLPVAALAAIAVGLWRGWFFVPVFAAYVSILGGLMALVAFVAAVVMSASSIPSPGLIARRKPATLGVQRSAGVLKAITFVLVLLVIGPAWTALGQSLAQADQLSRWERLANYASLAFPDASEPEMKALEPGGREARPSRRGERVGGVQHDLRTR